MDDKKTVADFLLLFSSVLWEAMPFIVLGALIAGILEEFLPQEAITRFLPKSVLPSVMVGAVIGIVFPMCECGIVVVMRRLLRKGLPLSTCIAYMLAGPIINVIVIGSTWVAFGPFGMGPEVVGLRVGLGFLVACTTALLVQSQYRKYGNSLLTVVAAPKDPVPVPVAARPTKTLAEANAVEPTLTNEPDEAGKPAKKPFMERLSNISATALHDFVDITVFLIVGAVLAAIAKQQIGSTQIEQFSQQQPLLAIPAMMILAVLMCLCSEADAFVAASFTQMHISAKIAFLVLGPMLDLKLLMMFTRVFKPRLILLIVCSTVILTLIVSLSVHGVYVMNGWSGLPRPALKS